MVEDDNIWKREEIIFKCPKCFYALTLRKNSRKYKCPACGRLYPQKEIEENEFSKYNKKERKRILVETYGEEILTAKGQKKYYLKHKEEINAMNNENYRKNKEIQIKKNKEYYKKYPEKCKAIHKKYYEKNLEKYKTISKRYYEKNKLKILARQKEKNRLKKIQQNSKSPTGQ